LEETYRAMLQQVPKEGAAAVEAMPVDFPKLAQAMSRELRSDVRIEPDKLSPGGYSKVTIFAEMTQDGASTSVVVRVDVGAGVSGTSVLDEYPVLRALFAAGIAVPRPIWAGRLGESKAGVMVVENVHGISFGSPISSVLQDDRLCASLGSNLARLHGVPLAAVEGILESQDTHQQILAAIETSLEMLKGTGVESPLHLYAFEWLRDHIDCVQPRSAIVHGDYGPHNLLVSDSQVNAILDWELVKIGHPAEDLCWSRLAVEALGSWQIFLDAYTEAGGERPGEAELRYFSIVSLARVSVMQLQIDLSFGKGPATLVRWAGPGVERLRPTMLRLGAMLGLDQATNAAM
jgi:aminoglycoside phosphotransferase (APT) family kinase protein